MDRSIIVLMKSVKITFWVQKFKNFLGGAGGSRVTYSWFLTFPRTEIKYTQKNQETAPKTSF